MIRRGEGRAVRGRRDRGREECERERERERERGLVECRKEQQVTFKPERADCHKILSQEEKGNGHPCPKRATRKATGAEKPSLGDDNRIITPTYTADIVFEQGIPGLT